MGAQTLPRWAAFGLVGLAVAALPLACSKSPPATDAPTGVAGNSQPAGPPYFEDVTARSGIAFTYKNGEEAGHFTMLETLGGGVGLLDYDGDGLLDIFLSGGGHFGPNKEILGHPCKLFRNEGNWRFRDVTADAGLDKIDCYTHGVTVGDYNNDGSPDLLITGYGRLGLYRNNKGKFEDVTDAAGLRDQRPLHWSTSAAWADLNGDGHLDLFVAHYLDWSFQNHPFCKARQATQPRGTCSPRQFKPLMQSLYVSNGNGTFRDATQEAGIQPGRGLGVLVLDLDDDDRPDIYVANDLLANQLYLNRTPPSQGGVKFEEVGVARGVAHGESGNPDGSMGIDAADYNGSGRFSLFVTNFEHEAHALYRNQGKGLFKHQSAQAGITAIGLVYVGWGTAFIDLENSGIEDLFITNGHVETHPEPPATVAQKPVLLKNLRRPGMEPYAVTFRDITASGGPYFQKVHRGRGAAFGDLDNDGRVDIVISHVNEPVTLLRNAVSNNHHWLGVSLVGAPNPDAIGAKLTLEVGGQKLVRAIKGGGSYLSANDKRIVFGLGTHTQVGRLTVRWPNGKTQTWEGLPVDRYSECRMEVEAAKFNPQRCGL